MTYYRRLVAQLFRFGKPGIVMPRVTTGENEFGNTDDEFTGTTREVIAMKTYPNRNTEIESRIGTRERDRPVFLVPKGDDQPAPPGEKDHFMYESQEYEVKAHTEYDSHVEFFGEPVIH